jgi:hypothetical protein
MHTVQVGWWSGKAPYLYLAGTWLEFKLRFLLLPESSSAQKKKKKACYETLHRASKAGSCEHGNVPSSS